MKLFEITDQTSPLNFFVVLEVAIENELEAWANGDREWTVSNQFYEAELETALQNIEAMSDFDKETLFKTIQKGNYHLMDLVCNHISSFRAGQITHTTDFSVD